MKRFALILIFIQLLFLTTGCRKDKGGGPAGNPVIASISPDTGPKETVVSVYGTGFGNDPTEVRVHLSGRIMPVLSVNDTVVRFRVLSRSVSGLVSVTVNGNNASGPHFEYIYTVSVLLFSGQPGVAGFADGNAGAAMFNSPAGLTIDNIGNVYVADELNHRIRRISPGGDVVTFCGSGVAGFLDGAPGNAKFNSPSDIEFDQVHGDFYVADKMNHCIRKIDYSGTVYTIAGSPGTSGYTDAPGSNARFNRPSGITLEGELVDLYITDSYNHCIRKCDYNFVVTTFAGTNSSGQQDGYGTSARFYYPNDISYDSTGYFFVADKSNHQIRRISKSGAYVKTIAGAGLPGYGNLQGTSALFNNPSAVAAYKNQVAVCDKSNNRIRLVSSAQLVSTIAGTGAAAFADGAGALSKFNNPAGIVRTKNGDYYVADTGNHCIRKLTVD